MILDPITQAALALQRSTNSALAAQANKTIPVSFGHRVVEGFPMWVAQATAPSLSQFTDLLKNFDSTNMVDGDTVTIGSKTYTFQATLTNTDGHVKLGASAADSLKNLINAINASGGTPGTDYATLTTANPDVVASDSSGAMLLTAKATTSATISVSTTSAHLKWDTAQLEANNQIAGELVHQTQAAPLIAGATKATFAVALGYSLLPPALRTGTKVLRIWADDELIYDATNPGASPEYYAGLKLTFHEGLPNAQPDATIAADMGKLTPGFRNMMYLVLRDFSLQVGPTPVAPPPVVTQPTPVVTRKVLPYPGICTNVGSPDCYDAGTAWFGPGGGTGEFFLKQPPNLAYPGGGFGGYFISWISDSESRTGKGGAYNSALGTVKPYPVDIGNGVMVVDGSEGVSATIESTTIQPAVVTQAPAPEPTYRTTLPKITVELADAIPIAAVNTAYTFLDSLTPPGGSGASSGLGGVVDWDLGYVYQWTNDSTASSCTEHVYSIYDQLELVRYPAMHGYVINKNTPEATNNVGTEGQFDFLCAHDKVNKLVFTTEWNSETGEGEGNADPLIMIDLTSGQVKGAYGTRGSFTEQEGVSVAVRASGDCVVSTDGGGRAYGLVTGSFLGNIAGLTVYVPSTGQMTSGGHISDVSTNRWSQMVAWPIVDRADLAAKYAINGGRQDWYVFAAAGTDVCLLHGSSSKIIDGSIVWTTDMPINDLFIDPTDYGVVLIKAGPVGTSYIEKLQIETTQDEGGVRPVFIKSLYSTLLPSAVASPRHTSLNESIYGGGQFVYPGGGNWNYIDLGTGETLRIDSGSAKLDGTTPIAAWVYNSNNGTAIALGTTTPTPVAGVQLQAGTGVSIPLYQPLTWLGLNSGYTDAQLDVDTSINDGVFGGVIDQKVGLWQYLQNLGTVFNFAFFESEDKLKFTRGTSGDTGAVAYTIDVNSLMGVDGGAGGLNESVLTTLAAPTELASAVEVGYLDSDFNYQANTKSFQRSRFPFRNVKPGTTASYETYLVMTGSEALQRAAAVAFSSYAEGVVQNMKLPIQFGRLEPGDSLNLLINGASYLVVLKEVLLGTDWSLNITGTNFNYRGDVNLSADRPIGQQQQNSGPSDSLPCAIETTLPAASDDPGQSSILVITGVESLGQSWWNGAAFNVMAEGDTGWTRVYFSSQQVTYGRTTSALSVPDNPFATDNNPLSVIAVSMRNTGNIAGTSTDLWTGANAAYVGAPGRWELIYFENLSWVNSKKFTVTGILRGRRGTEVHCNDHLPGDYFIPFNRTTMKMYPVPLSKLGKVMSYAAVGQGTTKAATTESDVVEGASLKPWAITYVKAQFL